MKNIAFLVFVVVVSTRVFSPRRRVTRVETRRSAVATPLVDPSLVRPCFGSVPTFPSMLRAPASRTVRRNCIHRVHLRPINALGRPVLPSLVSSGYGPAAPFVRRYAQTPPGGQGPGGSGGLPGFNFPMQQQYAKGDALKEFVRALLRAFLCFLPVVSVERRPDRASKGRKA